MKKDTIDYIDKCLGCQQVKVEHRHLAGLLQPVQILEWKWEVMSMDFIIGLPRTTKQYDAIMVVVEKLSKATHFIPIKSTYKSIYVANIFIKEIFKLHGMPKIIISYLDAKFTSKFWKGLFAGFGMKLAFIVAYHPQTDGQT